MIKVIGFDLDGTLYENDERIQKRVRKKIYEKVSEICGIPIEKSRKLFEKFYTETSRGSAAIAKITDFYGRKIGERDVVQEALEEADTSDLITKNYRLVDMLDRISKSRSIDLLTSSTEINANRKLELLGIFHNAFEYVLTSEDGSKSNGEKYQKWMRLRNLWPTEHLYVGDNKKQDIDVPKSLGIRTCFIGKYSNVDFQIGNILELEQLVQTF
ncbi:MAG: HAD hydrolase-like protein [Nanoarchaeota archaeon]|nr:HAD hydrolase-like protein [Nanoarchaeota archaeon]